MQEMSERESRARSTVKTIDVSDEQCIFCPVCKGTDIELVDESAGSFLCNLEEWVCRECRRCFLVETKRFITYEEVGGHDQGSPGTASQGKAERGRRPAKHRPRLLVLCGPSHAGKSTFAEQHCRGFTVISSDRIRRGLTGRCPRSRRETRTWEVFEQQKQEALRNGRDVVLDACHLSTRARWHSLQGPNDGHRKVCTVFDLPLEAILARCCRTGRVALGEVERMWQAFQASKPTAGELRRLGFDEVHVVRQGGRRRARLAREPERRAAGKRRADEVAAG